MDLVKLQFQHVFTVWCEEQLWPPRRKCSEKPDSARHKSDNEIWQKFPCAGSVAERSWVVYIISSDLSSRSWFTLWLKTSAGRLPNWNQISSAARWYWSLFNIKAQNWLALINNKNTLLHVQQQDQYSERNVLWYSSSLTGLIREGLQKWKRPYILKLLWELPLKLILCKRHKTNIFHKQPIFTFFTCVLEQPFGNLPCRKPVTNRRAVLVLLGYWGAGGCMGPSTGLHAAPLPCETNPLLKPWQSYGALLGARTENRTHPHL